MTDPHIDDPNEEIAEQADEPDDASISARGECDCGAPTSGIWADIHSPLCASYLDDLESRIHAIAVKHCIALPEPVVREMVAYLLQGIRR